MEVVTLGNGISEADLLVYDEKEDNPTLAYLLSSLNYPDYPVPMGVFRNINKPTYDQMLEGQVSNSRQKFGEGSLEKLFNSGDTWVVE